MVELLRETLNTLDKYGADTEDVLFLFYHCIGLIPLSLYCLKYNNKNYTVLTNIGIHMLRLLMFTVAFITYIRYGFMDYLIKWNSLLLIVYSIVGHYYWVNKGLLQSFTNRVRNILKYIFYGSICIESIYILLKLLEI